MTKSKKILTILFLITIFCVKAFGMEYFDYKKFIINERVLYSISKDGRIQSDLILFSNSFLEGIKNLDAGKYSESEQFFKKAEKIWPEYFDTYFMLALIYEKENKHQLSARYYKTYLDGLKKYNDGDYRISGEMIAGLTVRNIEYYEYAYEKISEHLTSYGIDIDQVSPIKRFPMFLLPFGALFLGPVIYYLYIFAKKHMRKENIKNRMPEGFWMCKKCNGVNPNLSLECSKCGSKKENNG